MATYIVLNIIFMTAIYILLRAYAHTLLPCAFLFTLIVLLVLTAIFDNVLIAVSFIDYNFSKTLGITVGRAPIEDFMYAIVAAFIVPVLWNKFGKRHA